MGTAVAASHEWEYHAQAPDVHNEPQGSLFGPRLSVGSTGDGLRDDPCLVPRAEISERQIRDLVDLYQQWADEENRHFDEDSFLGYVIELLSRGGLIPIVLTVGEEAVGCVMVMIYRDLFSGKLGAMADHFYVMPEYRRLGAGKLALKTCDALADCFDVKVKRCPSRAYLENYYRRILPPEYKLASVMFEKET